MDTITQLEQRRKEILHQMESIRSLTRGSVAEQFLKVPQKGSKNPVLRGPYFLLVKKVKGKTQSQRLRNLQEVQRVREEVDNCRRFDALCKQFEEVTEQLGALERNTASDLDAVKKKPASRPPRALK